MTSIPRAGLRGSRPLARWLALGAVAGPVLFTLAWLVLGAVSPGYTLFGHRFTDYSPISQPISGLGMGVTAPYMNTAFVVGGLILVVGVVGVFRTLPPDRPALRRWSVALLACSGIGQAACGIFDLEAVLPHTVGFVLAIGTPIVGFLVAGRYLRGIPGWRGFGTWLLLGSPLTLILLVAFFASFQPTADGAEQGVAGLVQRLGVLELHAWFVAMGWLAYRRTPVDLAEPAASDPADASSTRADALRSRRPAFVPDGQQPTGTEETTMPGVPRHRWTAALGTLPALTLVLAPVPAQAEAMTAASVAQVPTQAEIRAEMAKTVRNPLRLGTQPWLVRWLPDVGQWTEVLVGDYDGRPGSSVRSMTIEFACSISPTNYAALGYHYARGGTDSAVGYTLAPGSSACTLRP